jgi:hypothetical protein
MIVPIAEPISNNETTTNSETIVIHIDPVEAIEENNDDYNDTQMINIALFFVLIIYLPFIVCNFVFGSMINECNTKPMIYTMTSSSYLVFTGMYQIIALSVLFYMYNIHGEKKITIFLKTFEGKVVRRLAELFDIIWYMLGLIIFSKMSREECMPYIYAYFEFTVIFTSLIYAIRGLSKVCGGDI